MHVSSRMTLLEEANQEHTDTTGMYKTYTPAITIILMLSNFIIEMEGVERTKG